ncbi:MAG TPA: o-succinylbenzoate synthase [Candidatus Saccharimonadales bacterium]|nr:o-succinylbenzoate synthase [Candidatus Saccharimonadales bacterium]
MKITSMDIYEVALPMVRTFKTGFGDIKDKREIIVKLTTSDGLTGFGESPTLEAPLYNHETTRSCLQALEHFIAPRIIGKNFETAEDFRSAYADIVGSPAAKNGAECAFWHLVAQRDNVSLKSLFGGTKSEIPVGEGVGIRPIVNEVLADVENCLSKGFARIKLKIQPEWDLTPLSAIRKRWPDIELMADGNSAYRFDQHKDLLVSFEQFNLSMLEQPLPAGDFVDHAALQALTTTPICLDESIESLNDARTAIRLKACKVINVKPGRVGGIVESIAIHDEAARHGIGAWVGGMLETGIGRAFNLALASKDNFTYPADMSPYELYYTDDITEPGLLVKPNGCIDVPDTPGLGFTVREDKLKKYTQAAITVS